MSGRHKRNVETFNKLFSKITRQVRVSELAPFNKGSVKKYGDPVPNLLIPKKSVINTPLIVSKFVLLSKETRKWYLRDEEGFRTWAKNWDRVNKQLSTSYQFYTKKDERNQKTLEKKLDELSDQYFVEVSHFIGDEFSDKGMSPQAKIEKALEKRRDRITAKLIKNSFHTPGTLLEVTKFITNTETFSFNPTVIWSGWFYPIKNSSWDDFVLNCSEGIGLTSGNHPARMGTIIPAELEKRKSLAKVIGLVLGDTILVGDIEESPNFGWIRLVNLLVDNQHWAMILHPTLIESSLHESIKVIRHSNVPKVVSKIARRESFLTKNLKESLQLEGKDGYKKLVCKEDIYPSLQRKPVRLKQNNNK